MALDSSGFRLAWRLCLGFQVGYRLLFYSVLPVGLFPHQLTRQTNASAWAFAS